MRLVDRRAAVHVHKAIPAGGGLGGGSADAAAVLRWAGVDDVAVAAALGADVPFCLVGGRARVRGVGEQVEPLPLVDRTFTLVTPPVAVSTPAVYRAWDELGGPAGERNDLEPAALVVAPELARWRDRIQEVAGEPPTLAGSGATWFVDGAHPDLARRAAGRIGRRDAHRPPVASSGRSVGESVQLVTCCDAGGAYGEASSCASSSACACGAS